MINPFKEIYEKDEMRNPYDHELVRFPLLLDVEATNFCNLSCIMCPRQIMKRGLGYMDFNLFIKIVDEAAKEGCMGIRIIRFGEPLLHPEIIDMIKYVKKAGLKAHITTNGLLLDSNKAGELLSAGLDSIIFSFQGTDRSEYQKMRSNDSYEILENNIKNLVKMRNDAKAKLHIQVTTTVLDESEEQIKKFNEKWERIVDRVDHWYTSLLRLENTNVSKELFKRQRIKERMHRGRCNEVLTKMSIDWDGRVTACCGDFNCELYVGDAKKESLKQIWNGERYKKLRELLEKGEREKVPFCKLCTSKF